MQLALQYQSENNQKQTCKQTHCGHGCTPSCASKYNHFIEEFNPEFINKFFSQDSKDEAQNSYF